MAGRHRRRLGPARQRLHPGVRPGARAGRHEPPVTGTGWLVAPDAAFSEATDPAVLRAALGEAARTIEAVDRCR
ncbi:hypothetical protein GCM10020221_19240 [Streptomyces thioluteus]|uniref:IclR-ED domain-containing protein n=1 Tax=Streptomyces thioluteus TaxID=66431 RepID=A0ABN3WP11_STRTU